MQKEDVIDRQKPGQSRKKDNPFTNDDWSLPVGGAEDSCTKVSIWSDERPGRFIT
jgi:hypothetical protein